MLPYRKNLREVAKNYARYSKYGGNLKVQKRRHSSPGISWLATNPCAFCRVSGRPIHADVEPAANARNRDHVWITVDAPGPKHVRVAINTFSNRNFEAGFDGRIRLGLVRETWEALPTEDFLPHPGLSYGEIESRHNVFYEHFAKVDLERLLIQKARKAVWLEAWGEAYLQIGRGIHQIHSRAASCVVREHLENQDGALRFYFTNGEAELYSEMLLFKFCGQ